ncbi:MAG TPA: metallophosphoesterase [Caulobacteraceae bacterium]|nr:metallophosphoesterase [Caulobacteraceae bacterium]
MTVRVLHLSDIHFGHENVAAVDATALFIAKTPFDLLVVSGDVTQYGERREFEAARRWFARLPGPRLVVPGNHDTPWMGLWERLTAPFARYERAIGPAHGDAFVSPAICASAANTARGWQVRMDWSKGEFTRGQAEAAAAALGRTPAGVLRLFVCHHPLMELPGAPMTARVRGGREGARRLAEAGVDVILSGHLHVPFVQALPYGEGRTYAVGAGTLSLRERGAPPGFNVLEADAGQMTVTAMAWDGRQLAPAEVWRTPLRTGAAVLAETQATPA